MRLREKAAGPGGGCGKEFLVYYYPMQAFLPYQGYKGFVPDGMRPVRHGSNTMCLVYGKLTTGKRSPSGFVSRDKIRVKVRSLSGGEVYYISRDRAVYDGAMKEKYEIRASLISAMVSEIERTPGVLSIYNIDRGRLNGR